MKRNVQRLFSAMAVLFVLLLAGQSAEAQTCDSTGTGRGNRHIPFVDANGDGFNDNAADHDGDGIPNGQDPDYVRKGAGRGRGFIDVDGDGINDNAQDFDGDGIPNGKDPDYVRPQNGTGRGMGQGFRRGGQALGQQGFRRGGGAGTGQCGTGGSGLRKGRGSRRGR